MLETDLNSTLFYFLFNDSVNIQAKRELVPLTLLDLADLWTQANNPWVYPNNKQVKAAILNAI